jgi:hypothetical protein
MPYRKSTSEEVIPENMRRPTPSTQRMEYMSFDGTVTMFLRVVAPQTFVTINGFSRRPPQT